MANTEVGGTATLATGVYSHFLQDPLPWMVFPTRPVSLYQVSQGIHITAGILCFPLVLQSPDSPLSTFLSLVPPLTPLLMFLRITVLTPPWWQIALSIVLTGLAIAAVVWLASRVYRVGILMYGKRPTFPEMVRWVRHS